MLFHKTLTCPKNKIQINYLQCHKISFHHCKLKNTGMHTHSWRMRRLSVSGKKTVDKYILQFVEDSEESQQGNHYSQWRVALQRMDRIKIYVLEKPKAFFQFNVCLDVRKIAVAQRWCTGNMLVQTSPAHTRTHPSHSYMHACTYNHKCICYLEEEQSVGSRNSAVKLM